jgi:predicted AlkP superfamily pyrophosphatase or phosphodiesterase
MIILGFDGLEPTMVEKFKCKEMMQLERGRTDISEFDLEKTVILWASFLTGKNMQPAANGKLWDFAVPLKDTFFSSFKSFKAIDVPAFSFKQANHEKERREMVRFFKKEGSIEDYDSTVWANHEENQMEFFASLKKKRDIIMGYFNLSDAIGHLSFGDLEKMKIVYEELESIAEETKAYEEFILIVSDHGMKPIGRFGDHTKNGFYSFNRSVGMKTPKITDFFNVIRKLSH